MVTLDYNSPTHSHNIPEGGMKNGFKGFGEDLYQYNSFIFCCEYRKEEKEDIKGLNYINKKPRAPIGFFASPGPNDYLLGVRVLQNKMGISLTPGLRGTGGQHINSL